MSRVVRINGEVVVPAETASVVETEPGVYSVVAGGVVYEARVSGDQIAIGERHFAFEIDDPRQWKRSGSAAGGHGHASIVAPMPGKIVRVLVAAGDEVTAGQGIVVVEAMKMQNEIKAPRAGRVTALSVKEGDSVNGNTVLAVIE